MFGVFVLWVWRHRRDCSSGDVGAPLDVAFIDRSLLFSLAMFVTLASVYLLAFGESARSQALLYPLSLSLTLLLECGMAALWGYRNLKELGCVALCSLVTHPALHLIALLPEALFGENLFDDRWVWFLEAMVVVAESRILNRLLPWRRADNAKLALAMNAFSFFGGLAIVWGLWWMLN
jgi:hypothetical protein